MGYLNPRPALPAFLHRALTRSLILFALFALAFGSAAPAQQLPPALGLGTGGAAKAQPVPAAKAQAAPAVPETAESLQAKLAAAQAELDRALAEKLPAGVSETDAIERRSLLELLVRGYERQLGARDDEGQIERRRAALEQQAAGGTGLPPGPYPLAFVDQLRDSADTAAKKLSGAEAKLTLLAQQVDAWRARLKDAEAKLRLAEEQVSAGGGGESARRAWMRDLAATRVRAYGLVVTSLDTLTEVTRGEVREERMESDYAARRANEAAKQVELTRAELDGALDRLEREKDALERELREIQSQGAARRAALRKAETELDASRSAAPRDGAAAATGGVMRPSRLERAVELRRAQADNTNIAYDLVRGLTDATGMERLAWQLRFQVLNERDEAKLREAYERVQDLQKRVAPWKAFAQRQYEFALGQVREQEAQLATTQAPDEIATLRELAATYRERAALYDRMLRTISRLDTGLERWKAEFKAGREARPLQARAYDAWHAASSIARTVWNFELFTAEDTLEVDGRKITAVRSVTVGKSVGAIVLLVCGYLLVSWVVRRIERAMVKQLHANADVARIARRWLQVILVAVLFIMALDLVKIPLTVFAFLGGALAIGFGFGAHNLLKNLMGGIMILIERPLKVGDIVQVGELVGTVTTISIRASTIRSGDGIETLIPNSSFIESNVTNWTYSSPRVRRAVKVGVAYGSDTRKVTDLLLAQAARHGQVLKDPAPRVIFDEFGSDALLFALEYWIDYAKGADARLIASDLRFMIEKALAEAGIAVPFPQRDVHLDAGAPLKVEVIPRAEPQVLPRQSRG